jgi:hypothetical protein
LSGYKTVLKQGRLHIPDGCYHVIGRGLERRNIFDQDIAKREFVQLHEILAVTEPDPFLAVFE